MRGIGYHGRERQPVRRHRNRDDWRKAAHPPDASANDPERNRHGSAGDLIIIPPGTYSEMVLMWKPVRLQGVGAASSVIDANPHPAGKLDPWRRQLVCLFGLALNGQPYTGASGNNPFDPSGTFTCSANPEVLVGWSQLPGDGGGPDSDGRHLGLGYHGQRQPGGTVDRAQPDGCL